MSKCYSYDKRKIECILGDKETSPRISHTILGVAPPLLLSRWCSGSMVGMSELQR
jgi:hypothetical protein